METWRPTKQQLADARGKTIRDVIAPDLKVLFVGINPGLYSGAVGRHFARPGNRFWKTLHRAGFTDVELSPFDQERLLDHGLGITNLVRRTTATAAELSPEELRRGSVSITRKVKHYRPRVVAVLGIGAYRAAFERPRATIGLQSEKIESARVWVLPNPSGLNANYQLPELARWFRALKRDVPTSRASGS
ncbi:MAG: G/U mismatch-specific DNA glycosylase [Actinomycetota bacterium]